MAAVSVAILCSENVDGTGESKTMGNVKGDGGCGPYGEKGENGCGGTGEKDEGKLLHDSTCEQSMMTLLD